MNIPNQLPIFHNDVIFVAAGVLIDKDQKVFIRATAIRIKERAPIEEKDFYSMEDYQDWALDHLVPDK